MVAIQAFDAHLGVAIKEGSAASENRTLLTEFGANGATVQTYVQKAQGCVQSFCQRTAWISFNLVSAKARYSWRAS